MQMARSSYLKSAGTLAYPVRSSVYRGYRNESAPLRSGIYNPDVPYAVKCEIVTQLCRALAFHKNIAPGDLRKYLLEKIHVDFENLEDNPVGMLLYEYLYSQRPPACDGVKRNLH